MKFLMLVAAGGALIHLVSATDDIPCPRCVKHLKEYPEGPLKGGKLPDRNDISLKAIELSHLMRISLAPSLYRSFAIQKL